MTPVFSGVRVDLAAGISRGLPAEGVVTQVYGQVSVTGSFHAGIDIANVPGTSIYCPAPGVVHFVGRAADGWGFGNWVSVAHGDGWFSGYAHMRSPAVRTGQVVGVGSLLGDMGSTGISTGPHLHWAVSTNPFFANNPAETRDPLSFLEDESLANEAIAQLIAAVGGTPERVAAMARDGLALDGRVSNWETRKVPFLAQEYPALAARVASLESALAAIDAAQVVRMTAAAEIISGVFRDAFTPERLDALAQAIKLLQTNEGENT